jgi:hypothetical protein
VDSMVIRHLFISHGHNFFGHHGQPAGTDPAIERIDIECVAGKGIRGDLLRVPERLQGTTPLGRRFLISLVLIEPFRSGFEYGRLRPDTRDIPW